MQAWTFCLNLFHLAHCFISAHVNDCYHPIVFKHFAVGETIQTGRCSIALCKAPPFDIEETLLVKLDRKKFQIFSKLTLLGFRCACAPTTINYKSGCFEGSPDLKKDYPECCTRPRICV